MEWGIVLTFAGIIATLFAVKYARHAWLDPMPKLIDLSMSSALHFKLDSGEFLGREGEDKKDGHIFWIDLHLQNISNIPASIRAIHINDFVLSGDESKKTKVQIKIPESLNVRCSDISGYIYLPRFFNLRGSGVVDIRPDGEILSSGDKGILRVVIAFEDVPKEITVNIHTPNRKKPFPFVIEGEKIRGITQESEYGVVCEWFR